jgi:predicted regulator of Ras-like GTPase activity (Roadblock/LC7/MglB family)
VTRGDDSIPGLPREQARTAFTGLLEEVVVGCPGAVAAVFSDADGETVDYCTFLEVFDTQLTGAQWSADLAALASAVERWGLGSLESVHVRGPDRDFLIQTVGEGYYLTIVLHHGVGWGHALARAGELARALRRESRF